MTTKEIQEAQFQEQQKMNKKLNWLLLGLGIIIGMQVGIHLFS